MWTPKQSLLKPLKIMRNTKELPISGMNCDLSKEEGKDFKTIESNLTLTIKSREKPITTE